MLHPQIKEFSIQIRYHQRFTYTAMHYFNMNSQLLFTVMVDVTDWNLKFPDNLLSLALCLPYDA